VKIIFTSPQVLSQELRSPDSLLLETAAEMGAQRLFIDGISLLRAIPNDYNNGSEDNGNGVGWYRQTLQQLLEGFQRENLTALLTHEVTSIAQQAFALEVTEFLTDTVLVLRREPSQRGSHRSLEITKTAARAMTAVGTRCASQPARGWKCSAASRPHPLTPVQKDNRRPTTDNR
jgi:hypothetical protein